MLLVTRPGRTKRVLIQISHHVHGVENSPVMGDLCALAKDSVRHKCSCNGHWKSVCKAKHVSEVRMVRRTFFFE